MQNLASSNKHSHAVEYGGPGVQYVRFTARSKLDSQLDSQV